jgi:hypothetical protein
MEEEFKEFLLCILLIKSAIIFIVIIKLIVINVIIHFIYTHHNKYYHSLKINLVPFIYSFMVFPIIRFIIPVLKIITLKVIIIRSCNSIIVIVFISIHYVSYYSHQIITSFIITHLMFILVTNYIDFCITVFKNLVY